MITIKIGLKHISGVITYGAEVPTTEAKAEELIKGFIITWFPAARNDTGWLTREGLIQREFTLNEGMKVVFFKRKMH